MSGTTTTAVAVNFKPEDYQKKQSLDVIKRMGAGIAASVNDALPAFMRGQATPMLRALYTECTKTPKLLECTPASLFGAVIQCGQMGLQLGGALGQAYLIPFKGQANLIVGYKGLVQLVNRSGQVGVISARTVYDSDAFQMEYGSNPKIDHKPKVYTSLEDVQKRRAVGYYATCQTKSGATFFYLSYFEAVEHRRKFAMMKSGGPWDQHFDAMAMKTCIRMLCKALPMSAEVQTAVHVDEMAETDSGNGSDLSFIFAASVEHETIDVTPKSQAEQLADRLQNATGAGDKPDARKELEKIEKELSAGKGGTLPGMDAGRREKDASRM